MTDHKALIEKLTPTFCAMSPLEKWETLVLSGIIGTNEPWIEDVRQSLKEQANAIRELTEEVEALEEVGGKLTDRAEAAEAEVERLRALRDEWAERAARCECADGGRMASAAAPIIRAEVEAEIVAWLREGDTCFHCGNMTAAADLIERGDHRELLLTEDMELKG